MARRILAAGNWKMNKTPSETKALIAEMAPAVASDEVDVLLCVPAIDIPAAVEAAKGTNIAIGGENLYFEESGAYTGEISAEMLVDAGATYVIMGHSERRDYFGETDEDVNKKVHKALEHNLIPVMCCGESLTQREQGITMDWIRQQVKVGLLNVSAEDVKKVVIAYEPIWAIGTGKTATADQAEEVCKGIRDLLRELYGDAVAEEVRVLYGGSVNPGNAAELFAKEDIDGGLVGGASLKTSFGEIVNYNK
uniref:triose-phosphate isomerase n=1 Tax=Eubacterium cellulosolvens TaxID=29322 RepID=UPI0004828F7A|nr:triose-phosphate isomerase [[Eubacterium] cellulosolvens]